MKRSLLLLLVCISLTLLTNSAYSQPGYGQSVGIRIGNFPGVTYKKFIQETAAIEGLLSFGTNRFYLAGLYELHYPDVLDHGLTPFIGGGAHTGFNSSFVDRDEVILGLDGILGIDYAFEEFPLNASLDYKPQLNFFGDRTFQALNLGLSLRYYF